MRAFVCVSLLALVTAKPSKIARNGDLLSCAAGTNVSLKQCQFTFLPKELTQTIYANYNFYV